MMRLSLELRNLSMLTVGSAYPRLTLADISTYRVGGEILIPGSSLKGTLRTAAHRVAGKFGLKSCGEVSPDRILEAHKKMGGVCDVCKLFGMPGPAEISHSKLFVSELRPKRRVETALVTRISIDPRRGKVRKGGLFKVEVIPPCTTFEGEITLLDEDERHVELLLASIGELRQMSFGRGGMVDVKLGEVPIERYEYLKEWRWDVCP